MSGYLICILIGIQLRLARQRIACAVSFLYQLSRYTDNGPVNNVAPRVIMCWNVSLCPASIVGVGALGVTY